MDDPENEPKTLTGMMLHAMDRQAIAAAIELGLPPTASAREIYEAQKEQLESQHRGISAAMSRIDDSLGVCFYLPKYLDLHDQLDILRQTLPFETPREETKAALLRYLQTLHTMDAYTAGQFPQHYRRGMFLDSFDGFFRFIGSYISGQTFHGEQLPKNMDELRKWFDADGE